jgi:phospholipase/carboxylesterase
MTTTLARLPAEGPPTLLFLLLHGHGQDETAMQPLAIALGRDYPQAAVLCLRAPHPADAAPGREPAAGFQYFSRVDISDANRSARVSAVLPAFVAEVRALQAHFGIGWAHTALAGFSQGGIVALEAVQAEPRLAGRVLAFGARHAEPPVHAPEDTTVHLLHGWRDGVIPHTLPVDSAERLLALGGDVTADILPGIGHELHPALIDKALEQLRSFLPKRVWREVMSEAPIVSRPVSSRELG